MHPLDIDGILDLYMYPLDIDSILDPYMNPLIDSIVRSIYVPFRYK